MLDLSRNNQLTEYQKEAVIYLTRILRPGWLTIRRSSPLRSPSSWPHCYEGRVAGGNLTPRRSQNRA